MRASGFRIFSRVGLRKGGDSWPKTGKFPLEAVKRCRECSGLDLKNAKKAVEELESSLRSEFPDKFPAPPRGKGCSVTAAVLFLVAAATYWQLGS